MFGRMVVLAQGQNAEMTALIDLVEQDAVSPEDFSAKGATVVAEMLNLIDAERNSVWAMAQLEAPTSPVGVRPDAFAEAHDLYFDAYEDELRVPGNVAIQGRVTILLNRFMASSARIYDALDTCPGG